MLEIQGTMTDRLSQITESFDLIRRFAVLHGWVPVGFRSFDVGDWQVTVNGTRDARDNIPPFHARVENMRYVGTMLMSPRGGSVLGYEHTEAEFCEAMRTALDVARE